MGIRGRQVSLRAAAERPMTLRLSCLCLLLLQNLSTLLSKIDILIQQPGVLTVILLPDGMGGLVEWENWMHPAVGLQSG